MDWKRLRQQLRKEAREYLADLRAIRESLRSTEGWIALGLVILAFVVVSAWFITGLGFTPITHGTFGAWRHCRPIAERDALLLALDAVVMLLLAAFALGEMMALLGRRNRGEAVEPRLVAVLAALLVVFGVGGTLYMRAIC